MSDRLGVDSLKCRGQDLGCRVKGVGLRLGQGSGCSRLRRGLTEQVRGQAQAAHGADGGRRQENHSWHRQEQARRGASRHLQLPPRAHAWRRASSQAAAGGSSRRRATPRQAQGRDSLCALPAADEPQLRRRAQRAATSLAPLARRRRPRRKPLARCITRCNQPCVSRAPPSAAPSPLPLRAPLPAAREGAGV